MTQFQLGAYSCPVSTQSVAAQRLFDQGMIWTFGFNHEEGIQCFERALLADSQLAIAHWGIAYANGPFYNLKWSDLPESEAMAKNAACVDHLRIAKALLVANNVADDTEVGLIDALSHRFQAPSEFSMQSLATRDDSYADAMRVLYSRFPDNPDVVALFVDALMCRTPWQLWDTRSGEPSTDADTMEALAACEHGISALKKSGSVPHPGLLHLHIHLVEMSTEPERALASAYQLSELCPDAGHLMHMPTHIHVLTGEYESAKNASEQAIAADRKYLDYAGGRNFYTLSRCHNLHMMVYACAFLGQFSSALAAAQEMREGLTTDVVLNPKNPVLESALDGYFAVEVHVLIRFGQWQTIVDMPVDFSASTYPIATATHCYGKAIAYATLKQFDLAQVWIDRFEVGVRSVGQDRTIHNNRAVDVLAVGRAMMHGEFHYHQTEFGIAFDHLRDAVALCDDLVYSEPWAWMVPPRHALGALLIEQNRIAEAEVVYRTDLGLSDESARCRQHRGNVWALHGLVECLQRQHKMTEHTLFNAKLARAMLTADDSITSSCCCRGM